MRIIVMSDSHGNYSPVDQVVSKHLGDADHFIHLGDGSKEIEKISALYPNKDFMSVPGNCDFDYISTPTKFFAANEVKIMYTHGHKYDVKASLDKLINAAKQNSSRILLYGHTHKNFTNYQFGIYIMNPGSIGGVYGEKPSYGIVDITDNGIFLNIVPL